MVTFGDDLTVSGISSVAAAVTGSVAFELSFDRGVTWGESMTAEERRKVYEFIRLLQDFVVGFEGRVVNEE